MTNIVISCMFLKVGRRMSSDGVNQAACMNADLKDQLS